VSLNVELYPEVLNQILELRAQEIEDHEIAEKLGIDEIDIRNQEVFALGETRELVEEQEVKDDKEIAKRLGLPRSYILHLSEEYGIQVTVSKELVFKRERLLKEKKQDQGKLAKKAVRKTYRPKEPKERKQQGVPATGKTYTRWYQKKPKIDKLAAEGARMQEMIDVGSIESDSGVRKYLQRRKIYKNWKIKRKKVKRSGAPRKASKKIVTHKPKIDKLAAEGKATLREMMEASDLNSTESVRNYLKRTDQFKDRKIKREEFIALEKKPKPLSKEEQNRRNILTNLINTITQKLYSKAGNIEKKVYEKTTEFFKKTRPREISYEDITTVYRNFFIAEKRGEKPTLAQLGRETNLRPANIGIILKKGNLKILREREERKAVPKWKKEAIERLFPSNLGPTDLGNLLELKTHVVYQRMLKMEQEKQEKRPEAKRYVVKLPKTREHRTMPILTYRLSSLIYDFADDEHCENGELRDLLNVEQRVIDYAIAHRSKIAPELIASIQMIFPDENVNAPYINPEWVANIEKKSKQSK
jgi:Mg2+ and Co2+ transporter CorA